jgi:DNA-binding response OmpR family regulator
MARRKEIGNMNRGGEHQIVILVAEDEVMIRNLVTTLMQSEGYFVLSASDGLEGLELSRKYSGEIDLLITDWQMPRLNGSDLRSHMLEERPGIKVLVMSGTDMGTIVGQNVNVPFLPKPFDGETLKERVRTLLAAPVQVPRLEQTALKIKLVAESAWESQRQ